MRKLNNPVLQSKIHYKMYKAGKLWMVAGMTFVGLTFGGYLDSHQVKADDTPAVQTANLQNQTKPAAPTSQALNDNGKTSASEQSNLVNPHNSTPASEQRQQLTSKAAGVTVQQNEVKPVVSRANGQSSAQQMTAIKPAVVVSRAVRTTATSQATSDVSRQSQSAVTLATSASVSSEQGSGTIQKSSFDSAANRSLTSRAQANVLRTRVSENISNSELKATKTNLAKLNRPVEITRVAAASSTQASPVLTQNATIGTKNGTVDKTTASKQFTGNGTSYQFDAATGRTLLTANTGNQVGHATLNNTVDFQHDFTMAGKLMLGTKQRGGADGIAIVFSQTEPSLTYQAQAGGGLGIAGLPKAVAFTVDEWPNTGNDYHDPSINSTNGNYGYLGFRTTNSNLQLQSTTNGEDSSLNANMINGDYHAFTMQYSAGTGVVTVTMPDNNSNDGTRTTWTYTVPQSDRVKYALSMAASTGGSTNSFGVEIDNFQYTKGTSQVTLDVRTPTGQSASIHVTANIGDTIHVYPDQASAQAAIDEGINPATVVVWNNALGYGLTTPFSYTVQRKDAQTTPMITTQPVVSEQVTYVNEAGQTIATTKTISGVQGTKVDLTKVNPGSGITGADGNQYLLTNSPSTNSNYKNQAVLTYRFTLNPTSAVNSAESTVNSYEAAASNALSTADSALSAASYAASVTPDDAKVQAYYQQTQSYYAEAAKDKGKAASAEAALSQANDAVATAVDTDRKANSTATSAEADFLRASADASAAIVAAESAESLRQFEADNFSNDSNKDYYSQMATSYQQQAASAEQTADSATQLYNQVQAQASTAIKVANSTATSAEAMVQNLTAITSETASLVSADASNAQSTATSATSIAASTVASQADSTVKSVQAVAIAAAMKAIQANLTASTAASLASTDQANNTVGNNNQTAQTAASNGNRAADTATNTANQALSYATLAESAAQLNDISGAYSYAMAAASAAADVGSSTDQVASAAAEVNSQTSAVASQVVVDSTVSSQAASIANQTASTAVGNAVEASGAATSAVNNANQASATGAKDLKNSQVVSAASLARSAASGAESAASVASLEAKQATSFASQSSNYASAASDFASRASMAAASNDASLAKEYAVSAASAQSAALSAATVATSLFMVAQSANNFVQSAVVADSIAASNYARVTNSAVGVINSDSSAIASDATSLANSLSSAGKWAASDSKNASVQSDWQFIQSANQAIESLGIVASAAENRAQNQAHSATSGARLNDVSATSQNAGSAATDQSVADSAASMAHSLQVRSRFLIDATYATYQADSIGASTAASTAASVNASAANNTSKVNQQATSIADQAASAAQIAATDLSNPKVQSQAELIASTASAAAVTAKAIASDNDLVNSYRQLASNAAVLNDFSTASEDAKSAISAASDADLKTQTLTANGVVMSQTAPLVANAVHVDSVTASEQASDAAVAASTASAQTSTGQGVINNVQSAVVEISHAASQAGADQNLQGLLTSAQTVQKSAGVVQSEIQSLQQIANQQAQNDQSDAKANDVNLTSGATSQAQSAASAIKERLTELQNLMSQENSLASQAGQKLIADSTAAFEAYSAASTTGSVASRANSAGSTEGQQADKIISAASDYAGKAPKDSQVASLTTAINNVAQQINQRESEAASATMIANSFAQLASIAAAANDTSLAGADALKAAAANGLVSSAEYQIDSLASQANSLDSEITTKVNDLGSTANSAAKLASQMASTANRMNSQANSADQQAIQLASQIVTQANQDSANPTLEGIEISAATLTAANSSALSMAASAVSVAKSAASAASDAAAINDAPTADELASAASTAESTAASAQSAVIANQQSLTALLQSATDLVKTDSTAASAANDSATAANSVVNKDQNQIGQNTSVVNSIAAKLNSLANYDSKNSQVNAAGSSNAKLLQNISSLTAQVDQLKQQLAKETDQAQSAANQNDVNVASDAATSAAGIAAQIQKLTSQIQQNTNSAKQLQTNAVNQAIADHTGASAAASQTSNAGLVASAADSLATSLDLATQNASVAASQLLKSAVGDSAAASLNQEFRQLASATKANAESVAAQNQQIINWQHQATSAATINDVVTATSLAKLVASATSATNQEELKNESLMSQANSVTSALNRRVTDILGSLAASEEGQVSSVANDGSSLAKSTTSVATSLNSNGQADLQNVQVQSAVQNAAQIQSAINSLANHIQSLAVAASQTEHQNAVAIDNDPHSASLAAASVGSAQGKIAQLESTMADKAQQLDLLQKDTDSLVKSDSVTAQSAARTGQSLAHQIGEQALSDSNQVIATAQATNEISSAAGADLNNSDLQKIVSAAKSNQGLAQTLINQVQSADRLVQQFASQANQAASNDDVKAASHLQSMIQSAQNIVDSASTSLASLNVSTASATATAKSLFSADNSVVNSLDKLNQSIESQGIQNTSLGQTLNQADLSSLTMMATADSANSTVQNLLSIAKTAESVANSAQIVAEQMAVKLRHADQMAQSAAKMNDVATVTSLSRLIQTLQVQLNSAEQIVQSATSVLTNNTQTAAKLVTTDSTAAQSIANAANSVANLNSQVVASGQSFDSKPTTDVNQLAASDDQNQWLQSLAVVTDELQQSLMANESGANSAGQLMQRYASAAAQAAQSDDVAKAGSLAVLIQSLAGVVANLEQQTSQEQVGIANNLQQANSLYQRDQQQADSVAEQAASIAKQTATLASQNGVNLQIAQQINDLAQSDVTNQQVQHLAQSTESMVNSAKSAQMIASVAAGQAQSNLKSVRSAVAKFDVLTAASMVAILESIAGTVQSAVQVIKAANSVVTSNSILEASLVNLDAQLAQQIAHSASAQAQAVVNADQQLLVATGSANQLSESGFASSILGNMSPLTFSQLTQTAQQAVNEDTQAVLETVQAGLHAASKDNVNLARYWATQVTEKLRLLLAAKTHLANILLDQQLQAQKLPAAILPSSQPVAESVSAPAINQYINAGVASLITNLQQWHVTAQAVKMHESQIAGLIDDLTARLTVLTRLIIAEPATVKLASVQSQIVTIQADLKQFDQLLDLTRTKTTVSINEHAKTAQLASHARQLSRLPQTGEAPAVSLMGTLAGMLGLSTIASWFSRRRTR